jgi:hypothetical protein
MHPLFIKATSQEPVTPETRHSAWPVRNLYGLPIIGLAFYYTGFALVDFVADGVLAIIVFLSVPLLVGLAVRRGFIVIPGAVLTLFGSVFFNKPFGLLDHFGLGWTLAGNYIAFSGFLFVLTMVAWIASSKYVTK